MNNYHRKLPESLSEPAKPADMDLARALIISGFPTDLDTFLKDHMTLGNRMPAAPVGEARHIGQLSLYKQSKE